MPVKTLARITLLCLALILALGPARLRAAENGLPGLDGGRLTRESLSDGNTIIVVWASWSPRGRNLGERVAEIVERWGGRARVITINFQEEPDRAREFARAQKLRVPVFLDREATFAKRHSVTSLPFLLILEAGETSFAGKLPEDADGVITRTLARRTD